MLNFFGVVISLLLSAFAGWAIMSTSVHDGVIIKFGLIFVSLGFLGAAFTGVHPNSLDVITAIHIMISIGLLICVIGYVLRFRTQRSRYQKRRRIADLGPLA